MQGTTPSIRRQDFSLELQQAQAFRKMVILVTRGYNWRNSAWSTRVRVPAVLAQVLSGCTITNQHNTAGEVLPYPISWELVCSRGRHVREAVLHYLQLIVGDTARRPPSTQIRAGSCTARSQCVYTDAGNRESEMRRVPRFNMEGLGVQMRSECWKREATKRRDGARETPNARAELVGKSIDHIIDTVPFDNMGRLQRLIR